ncbi:MAG TPA: phosphatase PAP2 family protein [Spirochaetes bacterium]|nr:phosphatase PAP2 family protein [Spirochaetota bacterium]
MQTLKTEYDRHYHLEEILTILLLAILNGMILLFSSPDRVTVSLFSLNIILIFFVAVVPLLYRIREGKRLLLFRDLYIIFLGGFLFFEHHYLVPRINPHDMDVMLIQWDSMLFGGRHPTVLLETLTFPPLTDLLQIAYASFYFLPLTLCIWSYFSGKKINFHIIITTLMLGIYICYIGYYLCPAIGPRYTLADQQSFPLSGVFFFNHIRLILDTFEGVTRDCCPSGHTLISVLTALLAWKYHRPFFKIALIWAALVVFSTVYLRYHYVMDLAAGALIAVIAWWFNPHLVLRFIFFMDRSKERLVLDDIKSSI